jgi:hypothetical protein
MNVDPSVSLGHSDIYDDSYAYDTSTHGTETNMQQGCRYASRPYMRFNTSLVPAGATISNATLCLYVAVANSNANLGSTGAYQVYSTVTWSEEALVWANQPCGVNFDNTTACNTTADSVTTIPAATNTACWNVTKMMRKTMNQSWTDLGIAIKGTEGCGFPTSNAFYETKELNGANPPSLVIGYEGGATTTTTTTAPTTTTTTATTTTTSPSNSCTYSGSGTWNLNCSDYCNISAPVNMGLQMINVSGNGLINITSNINNYSSLKVQGIDSVNVCVVRCQGGCFTK